MYAALEQGASKDHASRGVAEGFCHLCHGKAQPLKRMAVGGWIIYFSPKDTFKGSVPCQQFTTIDEDEVVGADDYHLAIFPEFIPYRRVIRFFPAGTVPICPLIDKPAFIKDKNKWGYVCRFGQLEISKTGFELTATKMMGNVAYGL